jgi:hypothetical protein
VGVSTDAAGELAATRMAVTRMEPLAFRCHVGGSQGAWDSFMCFHVVLPVIVGPVHRYQRCQYAHSSERCPKRQPWTSCCIRHYKPGNTGGKQWVGKKYYTEAQRIEGRRKRQHEYYAAHRETIAAARAARSKRLAARKLFAVPQTAGKAIEPGTVLFRGAESDTRVRGK